jgi:6-phospho-beta-galactosidase
MLERAVRRWTGSAIPLERALPRAVATIYESRSPRAMDVVQLDWYAATTASHLRLPGHKTAGGRSWQPARDLWDDPPDPTAMTRHLHAATEADLDIWVVENGLCNRVRNGRSYPRSDGWSRPRYLKAHLASIVNAVGSGVPVTSYYHWTLADNYEWGSYEPRFGLYGVDRERGVRWSERDSMGEDAAQTYRRLISGLREGDRSVLR